MRSDYDTQPFPPGIVLGREYVVCDAQQNYPRVVPDCFWKRAIGWAPDATDKNIQFAQEPKLTGIKDLWHSIIAGANQIDINNRDTFKK